VCAPKVLSRPGNALIGGGSDEARSGSRQLFVLQCEMSSGRVRGCESEQADGEHHDQHRCAREKTPATPKSCRKNR